MNQLIFPLRAVRSALFRHNGLIAEIPIWLCEDSSRQDNLNAYHKQLFRVDTGATHSSMSLRLASVLKLTVPENSAERSVISLTGRSTIRVREGVVVAKFVGLEQHLITLPCTFHEEWPADTPPLLGLNSIHPLSGPRIRYTFDGSEPSKYPFGRLIVEAAGE
jgi:hypothetical protein